MPNQGEQQVRVKTREGHLCELKMQVTNVRKPLMSVSKICDAGEIVDDRMGQVTRFNRVDDVYRLVVELPETDVYEDLREPTTGFSRQAM